MITAVLQQLHLRLKLVPGSECPQRYGGRAGWGPVPKLPPLGPRSEKLLGALRGRFLCLQQITSHRTCPEDPAEQRTYTAQQQSRPIGEAASSLGFCSVLPYPSPPAANRRNPYKSPLYRCVFLPQSPAKSNKRQIRKRAHGNRKRNRSPGLRRPGTAGPLLKQFFPQFFSCFRVEIRRGECQHRLRPVCPSQAQAVRAWRRPPAR